VDGLIKLIVLALSVILVVAITLVVIVAFVVVKISKRRTVEQSGIYPSRDPLYRPISQLSPLEFVQLCKAKAHAFEIKEFKEVIIFGGIILLCCFVVTLIGKTSEDNIGNTPEDTTKASDTSTIKKGTMAATSRKAESISTTDVQAASDKAPSSYTATANTVAAPTIKVGYSYTFETENTSDSKLNFVATREITYIDKNRMTVVTTNAKTGSKRNSYYDTAWGYLGSGTSDKAGVSFLPALKYLDFPLSVGKKWTAQSVETDKKTGRQRQHTLYGTVEGWEKVQVPAGEFDALKIVLKTELKDADNISTGSDVSWYVPALQRSVKSELTGQDTTTGREEKRIARLISYNVPTVTKTEQEQIKQQGPEFTPVSDNKKQSSKEIEGVFKGCSLHQGIVGCSVETNGTRYYFDSDSSSKTVFKQIQQVKWIGKKVTITGVLVDEGTSESTIIATSIIVDAAEEAADGKNVRIQNEFETSRTTKIDAYNSAINAIQKSIIFNKANADMMNVIEKISGQPTDWVGKIDSIGTSHAGTTASIRILSTNNNYVSYSSASDIRSGTTLYDQISLLTDGQIVKFSGTLKINDLVGAYEGSFTEEGSLKSPCFRIDFNSIDPIN
jgi:hypothetical protein